MSNSTLDYWSVGSTSLQTYAFNVESWGGSRQSPPTFRGEDLVVPNRPGSIFRPRMPGPKVITLAMWVIGFDEAGAVPSDPRAQFVTNWNKLRSLLWTDQQISLTRRWDGGTKSATASAIFAGGLEPEMNGPRRANFTVDLLLNDPFFYGSLESPSNFAVGTTAFVPKGDYPGNRFTLKLNGPLTNPTVKMKAGSTIYSTLTYTGSIASGKYVQIVMPNLTWSTDDSGQNVTKFSRSQVEWVRLDNRATHLELAVTAGIGTVTLTYNPAYF